HAPDSEAWSGRMHPPACVIHHPEHHLVLKWLRRSETTPTTATMVPALMPCSNGAWRFLKLPDTGSFPLNRRGRLPGDVIHHPADAIHFLNDTGGYPVQQVVGQGCPGGRHEVGGLHGSQGNHMIILAPGFCHPYGFDRQEDGKGL